MQDKKDKGLSTSCIKTIALICMFIDHFAASVMLRLLYRPMHPIMQQIGEWLPEQMKVADLLMIIYQWMRNVGRISFPIYCFFIVEGFFYTKSRKKYAGRLAVCALLSEIPFDMAIYGKLFYFTHQNVFFTLLIGLGAIWVIDVVCGKPAWESGRKVILSVFTAMGFILAADLLSTDYSGIGVMVIIVMYLIRKFVSEQFKFRPPLAFAAGTLLLCFLSFGEIWALSALPLMFFYHGKKGWNGKYFFYLFYPVHLALLAAAAMALGVLELGIL